LDGGLRRTGNKHKYHTTLPADRRGPTADALLALDKQANEAYLRVIRSLRGMLSDKFVWHEGGQRMDKAAVIKMIAGNKCESKPGTSKKPAHGEDRCGHLRA